jgi:hypothetical protein
LAIRERAFGSEHPERANILAVSGVIGAFALGAAADHRERDHVIGIAMQIPTTHAWSPKSRSAAGLPPCAIVATTGGTDPKPHVRH